MKMNLVPFKKVGKFALGKSIDLYTERCNLVLEEDDFEKDTTGLITYNLDKPNTSPCVDEKDRTIRFIICTEELYYKGKNLIGLTIDEFISVTGENYVVEIDTLNFEEDDIPQNVYEFENIGLQVWEKGDKGKIVTIIVNQRFIEE
jgi:hypothetical protein